MTSPPPPAYPGKCAQSLRGHPLLPRRPLLRDLYECGHVFVRASAEGGAGEGLWARVTIPRGGLCALFNGVREYRQESGVTRHDRAQSH